VGEEALSRWDGWFHGWTATASFKRRGSVLPWNQPSKLWTLTEPEESK